MPINLVYRGGSGSAVTIPDGTVIWDGEKLVTYDGEEVTLPPCEFDTSELEAIVAEIDNDVTTIDRDLNAVEQRTTVLEASVTACNGRIEEMGTEMSTLSEDVSESLTMAKDHESRLAALEAIGIAEEGAY